MRNHHEPNGQLPDFEQAINSFRGYPLLEKIPGILFQRIKLIMLLQKIQIQNAAEQIAEILHVDPAAVQARLERTEVSKPDRDEYLFDSRI